jgi:hypothetical protein
VLSQGSRSGRRFEGCGAACALVVVSCLLFGVAFAGAAGAAKVVLVSRCAGDNAEVDQAVAGRLVYEVWIGCGRRIGFGRSVNGGRSFGAARPVRGTGNGAHVWDPALAVAPDGTVYVSYMIGSVVSTSGGGSVREMTPAVAVSVDHGRSFSRVSRLPVPIPTTPDGNWGDREFVAVGPDGTVYVTWDYGPSYDDVRIRCSDSGSCSYAGGDFNGVVQKSRDGGKTWTPPVPVSPGFPLGGVFGARVIAEPNGTLDVLYIQHPTDPTTLDVAPGGEYFTRSTDGGTTWSTPVAVDAQAGTINLTEWWIDGSLAVDPAGNLYAAWDTQRGRRDTAWLAWSSDGGQTWSPPLPVTSGSTEKLVEVAAAGPRNVYVAWQTPVPAKGYATYLRRLAVGNGWTTPARRISSAYGYATNWPGDTFGLSATSGTAIVSWGSTTPARVTSEIYSTRASLPARRR